MSVIENTQESEVPELEKKTGIDIYATPAKGIGGRLRQVPEDFIVKEITEEFKENKEGKYLILEMTKTNWETHHLIRDLSRALGISSKRIGIGGTKDKRAVTTQRISIFNLSENEIDNLNMKDVDFRILGRSNKDVGLGDLVGNEFNITIRDIDVEKEELESRMKLITDTILKMRGVPNFYGIQRFGARRPITHLVGESIVRGNLEKAAMDYIAKAFPDEPEDTQAVRKQVEDTRNFVEGLNNYPLQLRYERTMMHHLHVNPDDYAGAFETLSMKMRKLFVHAYQSYLFNRIICLRLKEGLELNQAYVGDIVCFKNKQGLPDSSKHEYVNDNNLAGMNRLLKHGRAFVTASLPGFRSDFASGKPGEIESSVLEEENVPLEGFKVPDMKKVGSTGQRREILLKVKPEYSIDADELNPGKLKANLRFSLPKGSYATVVLREYMKTDPIKMG
ncbi:tRNA pseudouridine13 synthase [Methanohalophilus levihalophilus]|uniref:tRNA pseudouridine(13) synthase TruD n=1 Tax=Methanohalophilus levihalophilus TaxID=1431282 RepID=UPI001FD9A367|nr:tRNA pseudouridine(13) synthase TruD [Methanohalophilus levihalophilus]MBP2030995.1 tRNA pseudouridine13 synthase [Methanohalophilus levihalophilus]